MLPLLEAISDGAQHSNREIAAAIAKKYGLTEEEQQQMLASGNNRVFTNRLAWAKAYLKKAGLLTSPTRGSICITSEGRKILVQPPSKVSIHFLEQFPSFDWHGKPKSEGKPAVISCQFLPASALR